MNRRSAAYVGVLGIALAWLAGAQLCCGASVTQPSRTQYSTERPRASEPTKPAINLYVATDGNDAWSGRQAAPDGHLDGPFATLARARDEIRHLKALGTLSAPVCVNVRGGSYYLPETFVLSVEDSGTDECPITYCAYRDEKPLISGGSPLGKLRPVENGLWAVDIDDVMAGKHAFYELFVNGQPASRPRVPREGYFRVAGFAGTTTQPYRTPANRFEYAPGDINPAWHNILDTQAVVLHFWVVGRYNLAQVDEPHHIVHLDRSSRRAMTDDFSGRGARYYIDNVFEAIEPGQWYLDRPQHRLYYMPRPDQDAKSLTLVAPCLETVVRVQGRPERREYVRKVRFRGLTFSHNTYELPPTDGGDMQAAADIPGGVVLRGAADCAIEDCTFRHLGTYGLELSEGCDQNLVAGCEFAELGAGGVKINGGDAYSPRVLRATANVISDNEIHHIGQIYPSAVGVLLREGNDNIIAHNHIHHTFYTGISMGWSWGYGPSASYGNIVEYNHIHDIGQNMLSDLGGIYTLGYSPGTVIRNNLIHDVSMFGYGGSGIYTDEGSSGILIEDNVVYRTSTCGYTLNYGRQNTIRNNIFALGNGRQIGRGRLEKHNSFVMERNIFYYGAGALISGRRIDAGRFTLDYNLYYNFAGEPVQFGREQLTLAQWRQQSGQDMHSIVADPLFVDAANGNFALKPDSPALELGFQPIDISTVGPRR